ncbi:hypothetical protein SESBI_49035 [Sesbania bispinosa]|nr:hypothetical protein SESBI_49035 [Sesbania bispinosa]
MAFSQASNLSCATYILATLDPSLRRLLKDACTDCNSLKSREFSSHDVIPLCINFVTSNHLVAFDFEGGRDKKDKRDWKMDMFIVMTSLSTLIKVARS